MDIKYDFSIAGNSAFFSEKFLHAIIRQWIIPLPESNPTMLSMFMDRNAVPVRQLLPWSGEFAGKYLTGAVQMLKLTGNAELREHLEGFVRELITLQDDDGYLGPWPSGYHLTGKGPKCHHTYRHGEDPGKEPIDTWDSWGHYHIMLGLLLWHRETGDRRALECVKRIADLFCGMFIDGETRLGETGSEEMNLAPIHAFCILYDVTREPRYLEMAKVIEKDFELPKCGDYIRTALEGKEFWQTPKPRWESLHSIQGIAGLYFISGEAQYKDAFEHIWRSIVKTDRHNTGGFSSGEGACGSPYNRGAIETCCTVAWMAMSVDMLRMTGDSIVADELELSMLNAGMGAISPSGRWSTYDTPMDGHRWSNQAQIVFQSRPGSPELNCCSVNAARAPAMLCEWAVTEYGDGFAINYYGPCTFEIEPKPGIKVRIFQQTDYPQTGKISMRFELTDPVEFGIKFRIPRWSEQTGMGINGEVVEDVRPGLYREIKRIWKNGDEVTLVLDMTPHFWIGEAECAGSCSVYRGPVLLAFDGTYNPGMRGDAPPEIDAADIVDAVVIGSDGNLPHMLLEVPDISGNIVKLCDFRSAGMTGNRYFSWLKVRNAHKQVLKSKI